MSGTLSKVRKPPHSRCYGIEIECIVPIDAAYSSGYKGFWFAGYDGSIDESFFANSIGVEYVSQPLPYATLVKQVGHLVKYVGKWTYNSSCGIHVHVSKSSVSLKRLIRLVNGLSFITRGQCMDLFGREPNAYCRNVGFTSTSRHTMINFINKNTIEFRMFASGDVAWAKECLRRTKLMVEYKGKVDYEHLLDLFTKPESN